VTYATEKAEIAATVADLRKRFGLVVDSTQRGPVPLSRFLDDCSLLHVALPNLTRTGVYDHLISEGLTPGDLGEDEPLAGFLYITPSTGYVYANASDPVPRRRFTVAHELGHFILHREIMGGKVSMGDAPDAIREVGDDESRDMERQANRFAAELLMPAEVCIARVKAFHEAYGVCPLQPFAYQLAAELLVSPEAMRYRLIDEELSQRLKPWLKEVADE
jgi:Zn-dependent peptidase ImmA (M78 family)